MTQYILIDTCCLRKLVSFTEFGYQLQRLIRWVENGYLVLLVPEDLKSEWEKHREEKREEINSSLKGQMRKLKAERALLGIDRGPIETSAAEKILEDQLTAIDQLLENGIQFEVDSVISYLTSKLRRAKHPPFHSKSESHNDAYILLSAMQYCTDKGEPVLYFVSDNYSDYTDIREPDKLHPILQKQFPATEVKYFRDLRNCFSVLEQNGLPVLPANYQANQVSQDIYIINKNAPISDQVYEFLIVAFKEWSFLPHKFLLDQYPFKIDNKVPFYRHPFTLYINNPAVYTFLSAIKYQDDKYITTDGQTEEDKDLSDRLCTIVTTLNHNLVYFLSDQERSSTKVDFFSFNPLRSPDLMGSYLRFEYSNLFDLDTSGKKTTTQLLQIAYVQYKMGNFTEAVGTCRLAAEKAINEKENTLYYISQLNLLTLGMIMRAHYRNAAEQEKLAGELRPINLEEIFKYSKNNQNGSILSWFHREDFVREYAFKIFTLLGKIRSDYYSGNAGFNDHLIQFLFQFHEFNGFLIYNYIFFEEEETYYELVTAFTEGLIASYGCHKDLRGKLTYFNDELLLLLVRHGQYKKIRTYLWQYDVGSLKYKQTEIAATFPTVFKEFMNRLPEITTAYNNQKGIKSNYFWPSYNRKFINFLLLFSYLELSQSQIEELTDCLFSFLQRDNHIVKNQLLDVLNIFIEKKGAEISQQKLTDYLDLSIIDDRYRDAYLIFNICDELRRKTPCQIEVSAEKFDVFRNIFLPKNLDSISENHMDIIAEYYNIIASPEYKNEIRVHIEDVLDRQFNYQVFYSASIQEILSNRQAYTGQYHFEMQHYILNLKPEVLPQQHSINTDSVVDDYLNFVFKENYELPVHVLHAIKNIGLYYEWLINIEDFDYSKFSYNWLSHYFTRYYKARYMNCLALKTYLLDYIQKHPKSTAQGVFIRIFDMI